MTLFELQMTELHTAHGQRYFAIGIVAYGSKSCGAYQAEYHVFMNIAKYLHWIQATIQDSYRVLKSMDLCEMCV